MSSVLASVLALLPLLVLFLLLGSSRRACNAEQAGCVGDKDRYEEVCNLSSRPNADLHLTIFVRSYNSNGSLHHRSPSGDLQCGKSLIDACPTVGDGISAAYKLRKSLSGNVLFTIKLVGLPTSGCDVRAGYAALLLGTSGHTIYVFISDTSFGCSRCVIGLGSFTPRFLISLFYAKPGTGNNSIFIEFRNVQFRRFSMSSHLRDVSIIDTRTDNTAHVSFLSCWFEFDHGLRVVQFERKTAGQVVVKDCIFTWNFASRWAAIYADFKNSSLFGDDVERLRMCILNSTFAVVRRESIGSHLDFALAPFVVNMRVYGGLELFVNGCAFRNIPIVSSLFNIDIRTGAKYATVTYSHSWFINNQVSDSLITVRNCPVLCVVDCTFHGNSARGHSAVISLFYNGTLPQTAHASISSTTFYYNVANPSNYFPAGALNSATDLYIWADMVNSKDDIIVSIQQCDFGATRGSTFFPFVAFYNVHVLFNTNSFWRDVCRDTGTILVRKGRAIISGLYGITCPSRLLWDLQDGTVHVLQMRFLRFMPENFNVTHLGTHKPHLTDFYPLYVHLNVSYGAKIADLYQVKGQCTKVETKPIIEDDPIGFRPERSAPVTLCATQINPSWTFACHAEQGLVSTNQSGSMCSAYGMETVTTCGSTVPAGQATSNGNTSAADKHLVMCVRAGMSIMIVNEFTALRDFPIDKPEWLLFEGSSAGCYKLMHGAWVYWHKNCTRRRILDIANTRRNSRLQPDQSLMDLIDVLQLRKETLTNVVPGDTIWYVPWSSATGVSWDSLDRVEPALTLYPAPGEAFSLRILALNEFMTVVTASLSMQLAKHSDSSVKLLRYGNSIVASGCKHEAVRGFESLSSTAFCSIAIGGNVGSTGSLIVTARDRFVPASGFETKEPFRLRIRFKLRPCHEGFYENPIEKNCGGDSRTLVCDCRKNELRGIHKCENGRYVHVKRGYWAGNPENASWQGPTTFPDPATSLDNVSLFEETNVFATYVKRPFLVSPCYNGRCWDTKWQYDTKLACPRNSSGPLCGRCVSGYWLKLAASLCQECSTSRYAMQESVYISTVIILTVIGFMLMLYFNVGLSPTLDSWLFFMQACWYVLRKEDHHFTYNMMYSVLTFGLGNICLTREHDRLEINSLLLLQPVSLLVLFIAVRVARSYNTTGQYIQRLQSHMLLVRVMWFVLVYSYFMLVFTSLNVLWCVEFNGKLVLAVDASIQCLKSHHMAHTIAPLVAVVLIILPPPIILAVPFCQRSVRLKGFIDEASRFYRADRRWWSSVNLLRRVAVALAGTLRTGKEFRKLVAMTAFLWSFLALHVLFQPFLHEHKFVGIPSNTWEFLFLFVLACISTLQTLAVTAEHEKDSLRIASFVFFGVINVSVIIAVICRQCFSRKGGIGRLKKLSLHVWWRNRKAVNSDTPAEMQLTDRALEDMKRGIREPLIVDQIREEQESRMPRSLCLIF